MIDIFSIKRYTYFNSNKRGGENMKKLFISVLLVAAFLFVPLSKVYASSALYSSNISLGQIQSGNTYYMKKIVIRNTGSETSSFSLGLTSYYNQPQNIVPEDWVISTPEVITLLPNEVGYFETYIAIPVDANTGDYLSLLYIDELTSQGNVAGTSAVKIKFTL